MSNIGVTEVESGASVIYKQLIDSLEDRPSQGCTEGAGVHVEQWQTRRSGTRRNRVLETHPVPGPRKEANFRTCRESWDKFTVEEVLRKTHGD